MGKEKKYNSKLKQKKMNNKKTVKDLQLLNLPQ